MMRARTSQLSCNSHPDGRCCCGVGTSQEVDMGLLDILNSIGSAAGDPRTRPAPAGAATSPAGRPGLSPVGQARVGPPAVFAPKKIQNADAPPPPPPPQPRP